MISDKLIDNIRTKSTPFYAFIYDSYKLVQRMNIPVPPRVGRILYSERLFRLEFWRWLTNKFYYEPMLRSKCTSVGRNLKCDGDIPLIEGSGDIIIGDNVFIGNKGAWFVTPKIHEKPVLRIGSNTVVNYRTVISVVTNVTIGNNCLIAEETKIFDNNSHGIDYTNRKMTEKDVGPITIEDNVWIGMNSIIMKNVTIGMGAVVAAGSLVTKNVPPLTLVGGVPAKAMKKIEIKG